jgi:hypothetical protein
VFAEQPPLAPAPAAVALARCVLATVRLLARRQVRQPTDHVGQQVEFADGCTARVYRETVIAGREAVDPAVLVVEFRLRWVRGRGHALFRTESLLNTPLFAGFPGFVSKLWFAHDEHGVYRGLYQWDGAELAESYVRALWWVLALVSERGSIHYIVLPGRRRDDILRDPVSATPAAPSARTPDWWRPTTVGPSDSSTRQPLRGSE